MKLVPTPIDREAAKLFSATGGMRAWLDQSLPHEDTWGDGTWFRLGEHEQAADLGAIDTDDPATVGVMLAQVEAEAHTSVELWHCPDDPPGEAHVAYIREMGDASFFGPTRGAALVAAMRALKGAK